MLGTAGQGWYLGPVKQVLHLVSEKRTPACGHASLLLRFWMPEAWTRGRNARLE